MLEQGMEIQVTYQLETGVLPDSLTGSQTDRSGQTVCMHLSICLSVLVCICLSIHQSVCMSACLNVCWSVCLSVYMRLSLCPPINVSV